MNILFASKHSSSRKFKQLRNLINDPVRGNLLQQSPSTVYQSFSKDHLFNTVISVTRSLFKNLLSKQIFQSSRVEESKLQYCLTKESIPVVINNYIASSIHHA